jgi:hypothetical protein
VGNEPSGCCCDASHKSARFTAASTRLHSSGDNAFEGTLSGFAVDNAGPGAVVSGDDAVSSAQVPRDNVPNSKTVRATVN